MLNFSQVNKIKPKLVITTGVVETKTTQAKTLKLVSTSPVKFQVSVDHLEVGLNEEDGSRLIGFADPCTSGKLFPLPSTCSPPPPPFTHPIHTFQLRKHFLILRTCWILILSEDWKPLFNRLI
jgi:hypothetical protein